MNKVLKEIGSDQISQSRKSKFDIDQANEIKSNIAVKGFKDVTEYMEDGFQKPQATLGISLKGTYELAFPDIWKNAPCPAVNIMQEKGCDSIVYNFFSSKKE